jgi:hypothetical protein
MVPIEIDMACDPFVLSCVSLGQGSRRFIPVQRRIISGDASVMAWMNPGARGRHARVLPRSRDTSCIAA